MKKVLDQPVFDAIRSRTENYYKAHELYPNARLAELNKMLECINPQQEDRILEIGGGSGFLTIPLSKRVCSVGVLDNSENILEFLQIKLSKNKISNVSFELMSEALLPAHDSSVSKVVSLASLHHIEDQETLFKEVSRILKPEGSFIIGDILADSNVQRYFDNTVRYSCSTGHEGNFLKRTDFTYLVYRSKMFQKFFTFEHVPWSFKNEEDAATFLHLVHDTAWSPQKCLTAAKHDLGFSKTSNGFSLNWKLFFSVFVKK